MISLVRILILAALIVPLRANPSADEIVRKFMERSEDSSIIELRNAFTYQRTSRVEHLKDDGSIQKTLIRVFQISPENGQPVTRLLTVNGRPAKQKEEKSKSEVRKTGEQGRALGMSADLLSRFEFSFLREEEFASRPAWVLAFKPKADAPNSELLDKLINAMSGVMWIDQEDYQMAKADVRLRSRVAFFGGLAGAIEKLDLTLIQKRIQPSVWLSEAIQIDFSGRKLLSPVRFRCFENCSGYTREPEKAMTATTEGQ